MYIFQKERHTGVLPVKDNKSILPSFDIASPTSAPPVTNEQIDPGKLFAARTFSKTFVTATEVKLVVGAPFLY